MTAEDWSVQYCELTERADLLAVLETVSIKHPDVHERRMVVIYDRAILRLTVPPTFAVELLDLP